MNRDMHPVVEFFVPWWAWPLELLHRILFGSTRIVSLALIAILFMGSKSDAQVFGFGGGTPILGTVNSPPVDTNVAYCNIRKLQFILSGATNTATLFTGNVYLSTSPNSLNNALLLGQFTNFGGANLNTNFSAYPTNPPLYVILQGGSGTNTVYAQAIYGP